MSRIIRLGTRRSPLALAQSSLIVRKLESLSPGLRCELIKIETEGDRIVDIPLREAQGQEFFVKEIDEALLSKKIDVAVHSMKDLSLERPKAIALAAVPERANPRDIALFKTSVIEKIRRSIPIRIGTSAPRRLENLPPFLSRALPRYEGNQAHFDWVEIRGNVNTRLSRLHLDESDPRALDGIVIALAGLTRLWGDSNGHALINPLLNGLLKMVLPLSRCPPAPGQGALAIECRAEDGAMIELLSGLHHEATAQLVAHEREALQAWGGGCHQKMGSIRIDHPLLRELQWTVGRTPETSTRLPPNTRIDELHWEMPAEHPIKPVRAWDGSYWRAHAAESKNTSVGPPAIEGAYFIAHSRAWPAWRVPDPSPSLRLWTAGIGSWFRLAELGLWIEGSAESLGSSWVIPTLQEPVLGLPALEKWVTLTHYSGDPLVTNGQILPTYEVKYESYSTVNIDQPPEWSSALCKATHIFWSSRSQWDALKDHARKDATYACGPGKTAEALVASGLSRLHIFPSVEEWRKWLPKNSHFGD